MDLVKAPPGSRLTRRQYLHLDEDAGEARFEYDGERAYMMAGASLEHNRVAGNVHVALRNRLREQGGDVFQSDMRVRAGGSYTYPDVVALCGEPEVSNEDPPSLLNPELLVEVLSPSTKERDRTWKLDRYLEIESLRACWLVETEAPQVRQYVRNGEASWTRHVVRDPDATLEAFGLELALSDVYRRVF